MAYRGHIAVLPIGGGGFNGSKNMAQVQPDELIIARNLTFESGTVRKEGGASKYNSSAISGAPTVQGGWDWWPSEGTQRMVVLLSDGDLKKDDGSGTFGTDLATGLTVSDVVPVFVEGGKESAGSNRKLFIFTGKNAVKVLAADAATVANISSGSADWSGANQPSFGFIHEGRLMAGGNLNRPHQLYYTTTTDHENVSGGGSISVYPGEGEKLVGGISFKGVAILFKYPRGIYLFDTSDPNVSNWRITRISAGIGCAGPGAIVQVDNDILFMDSVGRIHVISAVQEFGDASASDISDQHHLYEFIKGDMNLARLPYVRSAFYSAKQEAHFALAGTGSTVNNQRVVVDFNRSDMLRFRHSDRDTCESLWLRKDSNQVLRLVHGDNAGFVWLMDQEARSKDGAGYTGEFQSAHMDLGHLDPALAAKNKIGDFLECVVEPKGNWDLSVDIIWDGTVKQTITFNMGTSGASIGSFTLGTDALGGDQLVNKRRRIVGGGRRFSLKGRQSGAGQDFSVARFYLEFRAGEEADSR